MARPASRAAAAGAAHARPRASGDVMSKVAPGARTRVVADEPASRTGLKDLLTLWGYEAMAAADGQEALQRSAGWTPDLVIADLVMPGLDGMGLLGKLRRDFPSTAVVFLTGQGSIDSAVEGR